MNRIITAVISLWMPVAQVAGLSDPEIDTRRGR